MAEQIDNDAMLRVCRDFAAQEFAAIQQYAPITREWLESIKPECAAEHHDSIYFSGDLDSDFSVKWNGETDEYYNLTDDCIWHGVLSQGQLLDLFRKNRVPFAGSECMQ